MFYNLFMDSIENQILDNYLESNLEDISISDLGLNINGINKFNSLSDYFEKKASKNNSSRSQKKYSYKMRTDNLFWFLEHVKKIKKLSKDEEIQLFDNLRREKGNKLFYDIWKKLLESNLYLLEKVANQIGITNEDRMEYLDLYMEGVFALDYAIFKYNYLISNRFMSFAPWIVTRYMLRAKETQGKIIKLPAHICECLYKIEKAYAEHIINDNDMFVHLSEITGISIENLSKIINDENKTINYKEINYNQYKKVIENIQDKEDLDYETDRILMISDIFDILITLSPKERDVIMLRFGIYDGRERTLEEIGQLFGVTRERIRQIEAKSLRKLRHPNRSRRLREYITYLT